MLFTMNSSLREICSDILPGFHILVQKFQYCTPIINYTPRAVVIDNNLPI